MLAREAAAILGIYKASVMYLLKRHPEMFPSRIVVDLANRRLIEILLDEDTLKQRYAEFRQKKKTRRYTDEQREQMRERVAKARTMRKRGKK